MNGELRRRYIRPQDAAVSCPDGRWGRRRVRVSECWAVVQAEEVYTQLVLRGRCVPGWSARLQVTFKDEADRSFRVEVRPNAVWRRGRVFFECDRCRRRCTRLHLPLPDAPLACRRCYGLTFWSRTCLNYKDRVPRVAARFGFDVSHRDFAYGETDRERERRRDRARERWRERRC